MEILRCHLWDLNWRKFATFKYYINTETKNAEDADLRSSMKTVRKAQDAGGGGYMIIEYKNVFKGIKSKEKETTRMYETMDFKRCLKALKDGIDI